MVIFSRACRAFAQSKNSGFTVVELVVVIAVIAILAAITIATFSNTQGDARDSRRVQDMATLQKALDTFILRSDTIPQRATGSSSWARSNEYPTSYIQNLVGTTSNLRSLPVDPINDTTYRYEYYVYSAGLSGCDVTRGPYYILRIVRMESIPAGQPHPQSPGFSCSGRNWQTESPGPAWVQGGYFYE
ncbi:prepilin-type N-terminal cleavage/methylation domain-containing protein [Candidatus Saccharibacteria bacterium]|nr:prepilin-type N-terminal cleavage/methylation domain-containing protein [Candidatus Saccharibacteria bacterium]